tara:strand:- start:259 stop:465 length:207 start_codon:yes stop_codon:yes gene_type:complete
MTDTRSFILEKYIKGRDLNDHHDRLDIAADITDDKYTFRDYMSDFDLPSHEFWKVIDYLIDELQTNSK